MSEHSCHAIGCKIAVPPHLLMCSRCWGAVPADLRAKVLRTFRPGQEVDKRPSLEYLAAARAAIESLQTDQLGLVLDLGKARPVRPYRPSNATEGDNFQSKWCADCAMNTELMSDDGEEPNTCEILGDSMAYQTTDPEYPIQWRYKNGMPVCTAFQRFK